MKAKLVQQMLDEHRGFTRGMDPGEAMDVGLRPKIKAWLESMSIEGCTIDDELTINNYTESNIYLDKKLSEFPSYVKFGKIKGYFSCGSNGLASLLGWSPKEVRGSFYCNDNHLGSLEGCPGTVGKDFICRHNHLLASLEGCPKTIEGYFSCDHNGLTSLKGCPEAVGGSFNCEWNKLTSLEGCPRTVGHNFYCGGNARKFSEREIRSICEVKGTVRTYVINI